jgi:hypothetical protein
LENPYTYFTSFALLLPMSRRISLVYLTKHITFSVYHAKSQRATRIIRCETAFGNERLKGLSGMIGNFHVPF